MAESSSTAAHKADAPAPVNFAIMVVSTGVIAGTRQDRSGPIIKEKILASGHQVVDNAVVPDDATKIKQAVLGFIANRDIHAIVSTGGTGLTKSDVTYETVKALFTRELTGFTPLFMQFSYAQGGPACLLTRATAGVIGSVVLFALPGSPDACAMALDSLVLPEIAHITKHLHDR